MISEAVGHQIKGYLEGFIQGMVDEAKMSKFNPKDLRPTRSMSSVGDLKPFHESLLPDGMLRITEFERSFSTKLGTSFEECSRLIAQSIHKRAERQHRVKGSISEAAIKRIEQIASSIGNGGIKSGYLDFVEEIIKLSGREPSSPRECIVDLFIETNAGVKLFFEIKSPKPNKGQCVEATSRLLQIHALTYQFYPKVKTYYATAYNPYGLAKETYKHSFALNYMDIKEEVLIGSEFWDLVGGKGTYDEILAIYQKVGKEKGPDMLDQLALGY